MSICFTFKEIFNSIFQAFIKFWIHVLLFRISKSSILFFNSFLLSSLPSFVPYFFLSSFLAFSLSYFINAIFPLFFEWIIITISYYFLLLSCASSEGSVFSEFLVKVCLFALVSDFHFRCLMMPHCEACLRLRHISTHGMPTGAYVPMGALQMLAFLDRGFSSVVRVFA